VGGSEAAKPQASGDPIRAAGPSRGTNPAPLGRSAAAQPRAWGGHRRRALALEYDGSDYCGFQAQPSGCSVQDALERALCAIGGTTIRVSAAGRTDAGVHATSQIVHFDAPVERPHTAWVRGVNAHLPSSAAVLWCVGVASEFHARFSASARHYTYVLQNRPERPALRRSRVGWHHAPLDSDAMHEAAQQLLGTHDFSSFRAAECQARSPNKTVLRSRVSRAGELVCFDFSADGFLHHMIRNFVGALVEVGAGKRSPAWIAELLHAADRTRGAPTFAPDGLYFTGADYDVRFALPATRRDLDTGADLPRWLRA
jgi:tRNA pseudouridine38-40 synthase